MYIITLTLTYYTISLITYLHYYWYRMYYMFSNPITIMYYHILQIINLFPSLVAVIMFISRTCVWRVLLLAVLIVKGLMFDLWVASCLFSPCRIIYHMRWMSYAELFWLYELLVAYSPLVWFMSCLFLHVWFMSCLLLILPRGALSSFILTYYNHNMNSYTITL